MNRYIVRNDLRIFCTSQNDNTIFLKFQPMLLIYFPRTKNNKIKDRKDVISLQPAIQATSHSKNKFTITSQDKIIRFSRLLPLNLQKESKENEKQIIKFMHVSLEPNTNWSRECNNIRHYAFLNLCNCKHLHHNWRESATFCAHEKKRNLYKSL